MRRGERSRWRLLAAALLAGCAALGCSRTKPDLLVVYSGDCQGYLEDCGCSAGRLGGLARRATLLAPLLQQYPQHLVVDAGGWAERLNPDRPQLRSRFFLEGLRAFDLQIANVAPSDLALGPVALQVYADSLGVQFVSANVLRAGKPYLRPYVLLRRSIAGRDVSIGITGVTVASRVATAAWPDSLHLEFTDPIAAARQMLELLEPQSDMQFLLAYLPATELDKLTTEMPGYDVLVCGSGDLREASNPGPAPLVLSAGTKCKFLGWTALRLGAGQSVLQTAAGVEALDAKVADHLPTAKRVAAFKARLGAVAPATSVPASETAAGPSAAAPGSAVPPTH